MGLNKIRCSCWRKPYMLLQSLLDDTVHQCSIYPGTIPNFQWTLLLFDQVSDWRNTYICFSTIFWIILSYKKKLLNLYHIHQRHCCTTMCPCQYLQHTLSCVHVVATLSHDGKPVGLVGDALVGFHGVVLTPTIFLCNSPTKATARIDWPWGCLPAHLVQKAIQVGFPETCPYCLCSWASRFRTV